MADCSDVESVLVSTIAAIVYPGGTASLSIAGAPVKIHRGWPVAKNLDNDLKAKKITISVYPTDTEKRTTRYAPEWITLNVPTPSIALTASANAIAVTGNPVAMQNACVIVNGTAYIHPVQAGDTLQSIATALAAQISSDTPATSSGGTITIPGAFSLAARVGTVGTSILEIRRQKRTFQISFWCPTPAIRDLIAPAVDNTLADVDFLTLPDGSSGRLLYEKSHVGDASEKEGLYRRDLFYSVEYATTRTRDAAQIIAPLVRITGFNALAVPTAQATAIWDAGHWDDGISSWHDVAAQSWDGGFWDDGVSTWQGSPVWDAGTWDDGKTNWMPANTFDARNWDTSLQWDS